MRVSCIKIKFLLEKHGTGKTEKSRSYRIVSILILVYVVLGGIGNLRGSIIATVILYALPELLRGFANYRMLIYAIVLIVMMLFNWAPAARNWRARMVEKFKGTAKKKEAA